MSAFAGGYTWEFACAVLQNYKLSIYQEPDWQRERPTFSVDTVGSPRLRFLLDMPLDVKKARRRFLVDDVPSNLRRHCCEEKRHAKHGTTSSSSSSSSRRRIA